MRKFIKLAFIGLCLSVFAVFSAACNETTEPIAKTELEVPMVAAATYNGELQKAVIPAHDGYTVTKNEGGVSAGEYDVVLTLTDGEKYAWKSVGENNATVTLKFTILQADNEIKSLVMGDWYIGDEAKTPVAEAKFGTPVFTYSDKANGEYKDEKPTKKGKYFVKATVNETTDYKGAEKVASFYILNNRPAFTVEPVKIEGIKYDTFAHALVTAGATDNGTIQYKLGDDGEWSENVPTATAAGEYEVYYRIKGDETHDDLEVEEPIVVTIEENAITAPVAKEGLTYNGSAQTLLTAGIAGGDGIGFKYKLGENGEWSKTVPTAINAGGYSVYFKLVSGSLESDEQSVVVNVAKAQNAITWAKNGSEYITLDVTYGETPTPQATAGFGTITYKYTAVKEVDGELEKDGKPGDWATIGTKTGKYCCVATVEGTDNYDGALAERFFTVHAASVKDDVFYAYDSNLDKYYVTGCAKSVETLNVSDKFNDGEHGEKAVAYVKAEAFNGNKVITKVILPVSVTELKGLVFFNCSNLKYLAMPGVETFSGDGNNITFCYSLTTLIVKEGITIPGQQLQSGDESKNGITTVYVDGTAKITVENSTLNKLIGKVYYKGSAGKCGTWYLDDNNEIKTTEHSYTDGKCVHCGLYGEELTKGVTYAYDSNSGKYYVVKYTGSSEAVNVLGTYNDGEHGEKAVTFVKNCAFGNNDAIKKVILHENITTLDGSVFANCSNLEYVEMKGVTELKRVTLHSLAHKEIYPDNDFTDNNFLNCGKLTILVVGKNFTVGDGMFKIHNQPTMTACVNIYTAATSASDGMLNLNAANNALLTGNIYYYSESEAENCWHYDANGNAALYQTA